MTREQFVYEPKAPGDVEVLTTSVEPIRLAAPDPFGRCALSVLQQYKITEDMAGTWKVSTLAYMYTVTQSEGTEVAAWHWHPAVPGHERPHRPATLRSG